MTTFKKNLLAAAVASGCAMLAGGAFAQTATGSVVLSADGLGEALIYPYYTARGDQKTFVSIVNTTTQGKVVKVRFREGKNSNDVLDFNLYLSPYDVWTGQVTREQGGSVLYTNDTSCTDPVKADWALNPAAGLYGQPFFPFDYQRVDSLAGRTGAAQDLDRTLEGYMEVIGMANVPEGNALYNAIKHDPSTGRPANCSAVSGLTGSANVVAPTGGLFGGAAIIDLSATKTGGTGIGYGATAYGGFARPGVIFSPSSANPNFGDHNATSAVITDGNNRVVQVQPTATGVLGAAQSFAMANMAERLVGEYSVDTTNLTAHTTDWVVTMPAKHYFVNRASWLTTSGDPHGQVGPSPAPALAPFTTMWNATNLNACEQVLPTSTSREEDRETTRLGFSPQPPGATPNSLCFESTVISFGKGTGASGVLQSTNNLWYLGNHARNSNGWLEIAFNQAGHRLTGSALGSFNPGGATGPVTVFGLPVLGFKAAVFRVSSSPSLPLNNYAEAQPLHAVRRVQ